MTLGKRIWLLLKDTGSAFIADNALSRGAAIAYYTLFSLAPVLLILVAIAGLVFGRDAARGAILDQLGGLMGDKTGKAIEEMVKSADKPWEGMWATIIGVAVLIATASGVFGELQSALNAIWKAKPRASTMSRLVRARLASLGLVVTCGFLITVSLAVSAALEGFARYLDRLFPGAEVVLQIVNFAISIALISLLFAAIYKVLPDKPIAWRDVAIGAVIATLLFELGKYLIALYIGHSDVASSFGAAGGLIVLLVWIYYSAQLLLLGAEFTRAYAKRFGSHSGSNDDQPVDDERHDDERPDYRRGRHRRHRQRLAAR